MVGVATRAHVMPRNMRSCVWLSRRPRVPDPEKNDLMEVGTPCIGCRHVTQQDFTTKGKLHVVSARIALAGPYLPLQTRIAILRAVSRVARYVTNLHCACDTLVYRPMTYIHHTGHCIQHAHVGDDPRDCHPVCWSESSIDDSSRWSKSTAGGSNVPCMPNYM